MPTSAEKAAMYRANRKAKKLPRAERERKSGIGDSRGPASECWSVKDDPIARAAVEEMLQRLSSANGRWKASPERAEDISVGRKPPVDPSKMNALAPKSRGGWEIGLLGRDARQQRPRQGAGEPTPSR